MSVELFHAGITENGGGALRPPEFYIKNDLYGNLHLVMQTWIYREDIGGEAPFITYFRKKHKEEWENPSFILTGETGLSMGISPVIETYQEERLIIAFLGGHPDQPQGSNDVLIASSDDNGYSWNDSELIYISGAQHMALLLRLYKDVENRLHLLWGRTPAGGLGVGEMWHTYSEDGGVSWTEPNNFLQMEDLTKDTEAVILEYDVVHDEMGCIHWTSRTFTFGSVISSGDPEQGSPGFYNRWCSSDKQWGEPEKLGFIRDLSFASAVDDEENNIYLFWVDDVENGNRKGIYYSKRSLSEPEPPPVISQTGPLLLHTNYPNPFNLSTRIRFTLEEPGEVEVSVYDMAGRRVLQQHLGAKPAGLHVHEINMEGMTSGAYIYEVSMNGTWRRQNTMTFVQ